MSPFEAKKGRAKSKYKSKATPRYNQRTKSPVENNHNLSSKYLQKKRKVIIAIIVICGIVLAANWWQIEYFFEEQIDNIYLNSLDPVEIIRLTFEVTLTPQTEYHMYSPGDAGLFVYGLSNDQTEIKFNNEAYHNLEFCYPDREPNYGLTCDYNYRENVEIPGLAGSYFSVTL